MAVYLVCEGPRQGLDDRVLDTVVIQFHRLPVVIEPVGGSKGHGALRAYLVSRSPPHDVAIAIEDRDYRSRAAADGTWTNQAGKGFIWRRHEIENYLLQPSVVLELFNDFRARPALAWAAQLPATEPDVSALLQQLANPLVVEHAARVLQKEVVEQLNGIGSVCFGPRRPAPAAGAHAPGQAEWLTVLQQEAMRLCKTCNAVAGLPDLQPGSIAGRYHVHLAQFQTPAFFTSGDYLIEMKGKDLLAALSRHLSGLGAPARLDQDALAAELLRVLQRIYQPNTIYQPDDFDELATILRQY